MRAEMGQRGRVEGKGWLWEEGEGGRSLHKMALPSLHAQLSPDKPEYLSHAQRESLCFTTHIVISRPITFHISDRYGMRVCFNLLGVHFVKM